MATVVPTRGCATTSTPIQQLPRTLLLVCLITALNTRAAPAASSPPTDAEQAVRAALAAIDSGSAYGRDPTARASVAAVPGTGFTVAYLQGQSWCGTGGCPVLIFAPGRGRMRLAAKIIACHLPLVSYGERSGAPLLGVTVAGGGIIHGYQIALARVGGHYPLSASDSRLHVPPGPGTLLIGTDAIGAKLYP